MMPLGCSCSQTAPEIFQKAGLADAIGQNIMTHAASPDTLLTMLVMGQIDAGIIWHFYATLAPDGIENILLPAEHLIGIAGMQIGVSTIARTPNWRNSLLISLLQPKERRFSRSMATLLMTRR